MGSRIAVFCYTMTAIVYLRNQGELFGIAQRGGSGNPSLGRGEKDHLISSIFSLLQQVVTVALSRKEQIIGSE